MTKEIIRVNRWRLDQSVNVDIVEFIESIVVPRRSIGRLLDLSITALITEPLDGFTNTHVTLAAGIGLGFEADEDQEFVDEREWEEAINPIVSDMCGAYAHGLGPTAVTVAPRLRIHEHFQNPDQFGVSINNMTGPRTNQVQGWRVFMAGLGSDIGIETQFLMTLYWELEMMPSGKSIVFKREHVANEENQ